MKYFEFNNASAGAIATGIDGNGLEQGVDFTRVALPTEEIKQRIERLWTHKDAFKKFISDFENLSDEQKLMLIKAYYSTKFGFLKSCLLNDYVVEYPVQTVIKSNLIFVQEGSVPVSYKTNLKVLTKKGVRFNGFKTYTKAEIDKLIEEGTIVIVGYEISKMDRTYNAEAARDHRVETYIERFCPDFDKIGTKELCERFPQIVYRIIADIDVEELKTDYELQYMPTYKTGLKYLAGCARAAKELQAQKKRHLRAQIAQLDDAAAELTEVEKQIADTAKGR